MSKEEFKDVQIGGFLMHNGKLVEVDSITGDNITYRKDGMLQQANYSELSRPSAATPTISKMETTIEKGDMVNAPSHYTWLKDLCGVEPIDICQHLDFCTGNAVKYLLRKGKQEAGLSVREQRIQDLKKAVFYVNKEIELLKNTKYERGKSIQM